MPNRLAATSSPYLKQHENNPVDWYPWGEEALSRARREDKPIFLSIGYSSCHWCHVMEKESFSSPAIAEILNENFICIKVDREERPDLDHIYMSAVQMMSGQGGWPLNVFLTPDLRPFFGGTYFAPDGRYGQPPFSELLKKVAQVYQTQRDLVRKNADQLMALLVQHSQFFESQSKIDESFLKVLRENIVRNFEPKFGGLGQAPKFFHVDGLRYLLRQSVQENDSSLRDMVELSIMQMICGGVYDQVGGGFHRYSTDEAWQVPHFEKMLYDNALLIELLTEAWQLTKQDLYKNTAMEIGDWVLREMTSPAGGFYSAIDADSQHREGEFYIWSFEESESLIPLKDRKEFFQDFSISPEGNFEGRNILHLSPSNPVDVDKKKKRWRPLLDVLLKARSERKWPLIDNKVLVSWNGLMISALARLGSATGEVRFVKAALRSAELIWRKAFDGKKLVHSFLDANLNKESFLEDYAYYAEAWCDLFEATGEPEHFRRGEQIASLMLKEFYDRSAGGFWSTPSAKTDLLIRYKDVYDGALPAPYSVAISVLNRLFELTGDEQWSEPLQRSVRAVLGTAMETPGGFHRFGLAFEEFVKGSMTIVAVSPSEDAIRRLRETYFPRGHIFVWKKADLEMEKIPAFQGKWSSTSAFYQCQAGSCKASTSDLNSTLGV